MAERKIDFVFDSDKDNGKNFQLANGYISETSILFEKEKFVSVIYAQGKIEFYNTDNAIVATAELPEVDSGKGVYDAVMCTVNGKLLEFSFPIYEWIDTYPNCDGEHDRWITREIGRDVIAFDLVNKTIK